MKSINLFKNIKGFSLVEMAIVMIIFGIVITAIGSLMTLFVKHGAVSKTRDIIKAANNSLYTVSANNGFLPDSQTDFADNVTRSQDAFNKALLYIRADELAEGQAGVTQNTLCGRSTTSLILRICGNSACNSGNQDITNIAYAIISGGQNFNIQTNVNANIIPVYIQSTANIDDYTSDFNRAEDYDDIVEWVTLGELQAKAGCQGARLKILNNELPYAIEQTAYTANIFAEGGVPMGGSYNEYNWCVNDDGTLAGTGLTFEANSNDALNADCTASPTWRQGQNLVISGTPADGATGTYEIDIYIQDNDGNTVSRKLILTIQPD